MNAISQASSTHLELLIRQIRLEANGIRSFELVAPDGGALPPFTAGAHLDITLDSNLVRQYSLCNDPGERHRYVIAVLKDPAGKGGSRVVHERLQVGDTVRVSVPRNHFELHDQARKVVLLAGGIGVTPLKAMAHRLRAAGVPFELHYCAKAPAFAAFMDELRVIADDRQVHFHFDGGDPGSGLDIASLLRETQDGAHVYYCGPAGFMEACRVASQHWPTGTVHCEHFKAPVAQPLPGEEATPSGTFTAEIASTGERLTVEPSQNLAEVLQTAGYPVETSCQSGLCGTCKVGYLAGEVDHQDFILSDEEKAHYLTCCVSRARSSHLLLDL